MAGNSVSSASFPAVFQVCLLLLTPLASEEAQPKETPTTLELKMPPGLGDAFDVPADTKDAHGNAIRQATHEKTGYPLEIRHKATGMHFVFIPAGEFIMGSPKDEKGRDDDEKQHKVTLAKPFYMGKYEVTAGQFKAFVRAATYRTDAEKDGWAYAWTGNSGARLTALHGRNRGLSRRRNTRSPR